MDHLAAIKQLLCCILAVHVNFIPILNPEGKRSLAIIAYGEDAVQDLMFYSTLSQPKPTATQQQVADSSQPDFSASCWDHFRMGEMNENPIVETLPTQQDQHTQQSELCRRIDVITDDMKKRLMADTIFQQSAEKFVTTYEKLSSKPTSAHITSSLGGAMEVLSPASREVCFDVVEGSQFRRSLQAEEEQSVGGKHKLLQGVLHHQHTRKQSQSVTNIFYQLGKSTVLTQSGHIPSSSP